MFSYDIPMIFLVSSPSISIAPHVGFPGNQVTTCQEHETPRRQHKQIHKKIMGNYGKTSEFIGQHYESYVFSAFLNICWSSIN